jgi:hypothetical protein
MRRTVLTALTVALLAIPAVGGSAMAAPSCGGLPATIVGNPWSELIVGTFGPDVIVTRGGHDTVLALSGDDVVCGGAGRDIVLGGRGADRIFGDNGHDRLVGGTGFDELDGGDGRDRCNVGRDGGTETNCERGGSGGGGGVADLAVTMTAPSTVNHEEDFKVTVTVKNEGSAPSGAYDLAVEESLSNVECGPDPSGSDEQASLGAGESRQRVFNYGNGCLVLEPAPGQVSFEASVQPSGSDSDASNNSASRNINVDPPSQG